MTLLTLYQANIDPYARLFNTVLKWQKAEKKWTDGSFLELNAAQIETDIIAFSRLAKRQKFV
jgi:dynein heavy chain